ncbi:MAG TPA: penicillin-binding transpeptidase domain-containing protein [Actinoplanes sp.]|nr:penicillin-binding transpeptidase domain-containing protein [Actinoplanes sp.]
MRRSPLPARGRFRARRRAAAALATVVLLSGGLVACGKEGPSETLDAFLTGWKSGDFSEVGFVTPDGGTLSAARVAEEIAALSGDLPQASLLVSAVGEPKVTGEIASSEVKLDWTLPGGAPWSYQSTVRMTERGSDGWRVVWEPAVVHSELSAGDRLALRRVPSERAGILDSAGQPIVIPRPVVTVALDPQRITDLPKLLTALDKALKKVGVDVDLADLRSRVESAQPGARVDVVTLRREDYARVRDEIRPLPGTQFPTGTRDLAPTRQFARALLGTVDPATREDIDASPETIAQGDQVGHGGLQQRYDSKLRGTAGQSVVIARKAPDDTVTETQIFSTRPVAGTPVKTTLDVRVQTAADRAVATQKQPSALVAIRIKDSSVLAVANGPDGGTVNNALTGQVPPGSTFKVVSTLGLLQKKVVTANTAVDCPRTRTVNGREFRNSNNRALGRVPFHVDFAESCNTAFVTLAPDLGADGLTNAAAALGLGADWDLGIEAFSGRVSDGADAPELAAASFGQGRTVVSPIAMASATAAVARGQFQQPKLVLDPVPPNPAAAGPALDAAAVEPLRTMMREVITDGTGTALRRVPGGPVHGKTGTAEFETGSKETHAWFVGWQGDIAFAVMVQKGGAGADTAVPIVRRFLEELND